MTATNIATSGTVAGRALAAGSSNLAGGWSHLWGSISGNAGGVLDLATMVGVGCVVWAIGRWAWGKFRHRGAESAAIGWALAVGALLTMPNVVIPGVLKVADWVVNIVTGAVGFN